MTLQLTVDHWGSLPDRDGQFVNLRATRDGEPLGLFQARLAGPQFHLTCQEHANPEENPQEVERQVYRAMANVLASRLYGWDDQGEEPTEYHEQVRAEILQKRHVTAELGGEGRINGIEEGVRIDRR